MKLGHSSHDDGEKNSGKDSEKTLSAQESIELETITASKSLEEILEVVRSQIRCPTYRFTWDCILVNCRPSGKIVKFKPYFFLPC